MPDHDSAALLTRQNKRRRVDIGVKRTAGGSAIFARARETLLQVMNQSHGGVPDQDGDCPLVGHHGGHGGDGEKSNVLRKLLKRANTYEDAMMAFPGATIISQLLKNNMGKNGGSDMGFQGGGGGLSSGGSETQADDACSNASSRDRDSPLDCLSPAPHHHHLPPNSSSTSSSASSQTAPPPLAPPPPPPTAPPTPGLSSLSAAFDPPERLSDEHLRAKRARVENIIRGMSHSPLVRPEQGTQENSGNCNDSDASNHHPRPQHLQRGDGASNHCPSASLLGSPGSRGGGAGGGPGVAAGELCFRENKRKQRLPQQQHSFAQLVCSRQEQRQEERRQLKLQLEDMQKQLRQLQEKFYQIYDSETEDEEEEEERGNNGEAERKRRGGGGGEREDDGNLSEDSVRSDGLEDGGGGGPAGGGGGLDLAGRRRHHENYRRRRGGRRDDDLSDMSDPGLFLDRARALLREQALMDGEDMEDMEDAEDEDGRGDEEDGRMKRSGGGGGGGGGRQLAETLKQELSCAVSQVVDTVVKGFSSSSPRQQPLGLLHHPPHHHPLLLHHHQHHARLAAAAAAAGGGGRVEGGAAPPSSSSNSSSSCPPPFAPLPPLTPDPLRGFGGGASGASAAAVALALGLNGGVGGGGGGGGDEGASPAPSYLSSSQRLHCFGDVMGAPPPGGPLDSHFAPSAPAAVPHDQTEALPLVVRKSASTGGAGGGGGGDGAINASMPHHPHHHPSLHPSALSASLGFGSPSFRHPFPPLPLMGYPFQGPPLGGAGGGGYPAKDHHHHPHPHHQHHPRPPTSPDSMDSMTRHDTVSLRTKMAAALAGGQHHHHHHPHPHHHPHHHHHHHRQSSPGQHGGPEGLSLALIKSECGDLQDMADISPYSGSTIQEGLSPNHLKKAKLMFFYTRYPSSNMLKMFFSDVKFNRCITSQLIKWFSNFREFYYIQMEKFARQSINEGVTTSEELAVSRDAELFRALNMHYNKANDFEVPERFLEVSQVTLREFFNAIVAGKDVDPSWKKAIYKVICKLDSDVPDIFKSPNCLQELLHD